MHRDEITFPFKRYQIQPVWRADRPQKGRYREFYQCDADVVGSDSLLNEVELMQIVDTVFSRFNIRVCIKINNRKILSGIAEIIGEADKIVDITVAIDKLDKIGLENVNAELKEKGISDEAIAKLQPIILLSGTNTEKLATLKSVLAASETGMKGVEESEFILGTLETMGLKNEIELDLTLARGLNYYTGAIFEVKALDVQIGSITGGGRYDNLTGVFGMAGVSGVGISFGADRIFDVLNQLELYPKEAVNGTELMFVNFGDKEAAFYEYAGKSSCGRYPCGNLPGCGKDEEADELCQCQECSVRSYRRRERNERRQSNAEEYGNRRTESCFGGRTDSCFTQLKAGYRVRISAFPVKYLTNDFLCCIFEKRKGINKMNVIRKIDT